MRCSSRALAARLGPEFRSVNTLLAAVQGGDIWVASRATSCDVHAAAWRRSDGTHRPLATPTMDAAMRSPISVAWTGGRWRVSPPT